MPLIFVQRYAPVLLATGTGVQTASGTLSLPNTVGNPVYVEFDSTLWADALAGVAYPVFSYSLLTGLVSNLTAVFDVGFKFQNATFSDNGAGTISVTFAP